MTDIQNSKLCSNWCVEWDQMIEKIMCFMQGNFCFSFGSLATFNLSSFALIESIHWPKALNHDYLVWITRGYLILISLIHSSLVFQSILALKVSQKVRNYRRGKGQLVWWKQLNELGPCGCDICHEFKLPLKSVICVFVKQHCELLNWFRYGLISNETLQK